MHSESSTSKDKSDTVLAKTSQEKLWFETLPKSSQICGVSPHHLKYPLWYFQQAFHGTHLAPSSFASLAALSDQCARLQITFTYLLTYPNYTGISQHVSIIVSGVRDFVCLSVHAVWGNRFQCLSTPKLVDIVHVRRLAWIDHEVKRSKVKCTATCQHGTDGRYNCFTFLVY